MKRVLFIDRDGTIVREPADEQLDSFEKLSFLPGTIRSLFTIASELNFELVMVTNQDGLGTDLFPEDKFLPIHNLIMTTLENEGITFRSVHIDRSFPKDNLPTRKPGTGMLKEYIEGDFDLEHSFVIGDRYTDMELARNLGCKGILIREDDRNLGSGETELSELELNDHIALKVGSWKEISHWLLNKDRIVSIERNTNETQIHIELNLEGEGNYQIATGLGFFDHMLEQLARHGGVDLNVSVNGDLHIDEHHTIEDTALALGSAFDQAMGKKAGMARYGFHLPMDDCLADVAIDFGGRPWLEWKAEFKREKIGEMPTEMFPHFFRSFCETARCNLHIGCDGNNEHHKIEAIFKAFARSVKQAIAREEGKGGIPTTKGIL